MDFGNFDCFRVGGVVVGGDCGCAEEIWVGLLLFFSSTYLWYLAGYSIGVYPLAD
jgi:hypothetical protein